MARGVAHCDLHGFVPEGLHFLRKVAFFGFLAQKFPGVFDAELPCVGADVLKAFMAIKPEDAVL